MFGYCNHCQEPAELTHVGHGVHYCPKCLQDEQQLLVGTHAAAAPHKFVNQHGKRLGQRNGYVGERHGPLDNEQKARICILAREAFVRMHGRAPASEAELAAWRHEQQVKACRLGSLTHATQAQMPDLEAHFLDLKGESGQAFRKLMKRDTGNPHVARAVLRKNLATFGLAEGYAAVICRSKCKCELHEANATQLWKVIFQIRKNQQRKAKR